jgi:hypothetical protein
MKMVFKLILSNNNNNRTNNRITMNLVINQIFNRVMLMLINRLNKFNRGRKNLIKEVIDPCLKE